MISNDNENTVLETVLNKNLCIDDIDNKTFLLSSPHTNCINNEQNLSDIRSNEDCPNEICPTETIELTNYTHNKIYNYLIDELQNLKNINNKKDSIIENLNNKISELEDKLSKINNLELLFKLKEKLVDKQSKINDEINNENNSCVAIDEQQIISPINIKSQIDLEEATNKNIIDTLTDDAPSLKPKKKPSVFRRF